MSLPLLFTRRLYNDLKQAKKREKTNQMNQTKGTSCEEKNTRKNVCSTPNNQSTFDYNINSSSMNALCMLRMG